MKQSSAVIHLDLPAQHKYLGMLSVCISELLAHVKISERDITVHKVQLAAHEIAINIIDHAYAGEPDGRIDVTLMLETSPRRVLVLLHDTSLREFDPARALLPDLKEKQAGDFGLFLVPQLVDEMKYTLKPGDNRWQLVKNLS
jgi:serine/threonine-protein kinase RsbW